MVHRVTIRDVAKVANVHFTTVSMALRNSPRIGEATRARIKQIADELGYKPDPLLRALSSYRSSQRAPSYQGTIAWVNNHPVLRQMDYVGLYGDYFVGARARAEECGYKLEEFWLREPGLTRARVSSILRARGIRGVLIAPQPVYASIDLLPWEQLAAVSLSYSLQSPALHTVVPSQHHAMSTMLKELRKLGYRRIGFVCDRAFDQRCGNNWQSAYWVDFHAQPPENQVQPFWYDEKNPIGEKAFRDWYRAQKPEAIVPSPYMMMELLQKMGLKVPEDVGLATHNIGRDEKVLSGIAENGLWVGSAAIDCLVTLLNHQEYGIPVAPQQHMVEGVWVPGTTVRNLGDSQNRRPGKPLLAPR